MYLGRSRACPSSYLKVGRSVDIYVSTVCTYVCSQEKDAVAGSGSGVLSLSVKSVSLFLAHRAKCIVGNQVTLPK